MKWRNTRSLLEALRQELMEGISIQEWRVQLTRSVLWISLAGLVGMTAVYVFTLRAFAPLPKEPLVVMVMAQLFLLGVLWIVRKGWLDVGVALHLTVISGVIFVTLYRFGGVGNPLVVALPVAGMLAALLGGSVTAIIVLVVHMVLYVLLLALQWSGAYTPFPIPAEAMHPLWVVAPLAALTMTIAVVARSFGFTHALLAVIQKHHDELVAAREEIERLRGELRQTRRHEEQRLGQLQALIERYVEFLEQISAGEHEVRLVLPTVDEDTPYAYRRLVTLGEALNATVESLVTALREVRAVQEMYIRRSWEKRAESATAPTGFLYRAEPQPAVMPKDDVWLPSMGQAVDSRTLVVQSPSEAEIEAAVPMGWGGAVIGALGVRRRGHTWTEDELAILSAVADQLAQTIENLRLLETTSRQAMQERISGEIAAHIRQEIELEAVLERALAELGRALDADLAVAHLSLAEARADDADEEAPTRQEVR